MTTQRPEGRQPADGPSPFILRLAAVAIASGAFLILRLVIGVVPALVVGLIMMPVVDLLFSSAESGAVQRRRVRLGDQLPMALELIAAAIASGAPVVLAVELVAAAIEDPLGQELRDVAAHLRLGASSASAWAQLNDVKRSGPDVASATRAVLRAERTGARLAPALLRIAEDARAESATRRIEAAQRAGVMSALPLGLCFLPAFIVVGVVPIVVTGLQSSL